MAYFGKERNGKKGLKVGSKTWATFTPNNKINPVAGIA